MNEDHSKCSCWDGYELHVTGGGCVPITFTVKYDANGGTGTTNDTTCKYESGQCYLAANGFTKEGYVFGGWEYQVSGSSYSETYQPGTDVVTSGISVYDIAKSKTITFKAIWVTDVEKQKCENSGGNFYRDGDGTITCGCGSQKWEQDGVCGFSVVPTATYATDATRVFTAITVGQNVQLPKLSTWTYNSPYSADKCFYVHSDTSGSGSTWYLSNGLIPASIVDRITSPSIKCVTNTPILDACNSTVMLEKLGSDCSVSGTSTTSVNCSASSRATCESYGWSWTQYANVCSCPTKYSSQ